MAVLEVTRNSASFRVILMTVHALLYYLEIVEIQECRLITLCDGQRLLKKTYNDGTETCPTTAESIRKNCKKKLINDQFGLSGYEF